MTRNQGNERPSVQDGTIQEPLQPEAKEGRDHYPRTEAEEQGTCRSPDLDAHVGTEGQPGGIRDVKNAQESVDQRWAQGDQGVERAGRYAVQQAG